MPRRRDAPGRTRHRGHRPTGPVPGRHAWSRQRRERRRLGDLVTVTLNVGPGPGALWWYSTREGWRLLDDDFGNANGPVVTDVDGASTLIFADTRAQAVYAYPYDGITGTVGERRVFGDLAVLDWAPDGATADSDGGVWSCVLRSGKRSRFTAAGLDQLVDLPMANPSDVA